MPSQPDPNSPYLPTQVQSDFGIHPPGTPSLAGKPTPQAADVTFPAPPAVASSPVGRPPTPGSPAPTPTATPTVPMPTAPPTAPGVPAAPAPAMPPTAPPLVVPGASAAPGGDPRLALSPEGDARYRDAVVQGRAALGPVPTIMRNPNLPQMPFELGKRNYNVWTGQYDG
jgi:hypothetical protein